MRRLFIMRKDLHMSPGKLAAQVAHCAEAYWTHMFRQMESMNIEKQKWFLKTELVDSGIYLNYICGDFVKTICEAKNKNQLLKARKMADDLGLEYGKDYGLIYDKCLTELEPEEDNGTTLTGIWFRPLPDDVAHEISRKYHLYT